MVFYLLISFLMLGEEIAIVPHTFIQREGKNIVDIYYDFPEGFYTNVRVLYSINGKLWKEAKGTTGAVGEVEGRKNLHIVWNLEVDFPTEFDGEIDVIIKGEKFTIPWEGLVLYLPFDEGKGNIAHDYSGHGNHGVIYGAKWVNGISGKALEFDGVDDYVEVANSSSLNPSTQITLCAWIRFQEGGTYNPRIISKLPYAFGDEPGYELITGKTGVSRIVYFRCGPNTRIQTKDSIWEGQWYFLTATYDGHVLKIFVNGILDTQENATVTINSGTRPLNIGRKNVEGYDHFHGIIDEVRIYNRALSEEEIQALYRYYTKNRKSK